jgi:hypothetical protein
VDASGEFCLVNAFFALPEGDPGDHDRAGLRQVVISRFAVKDLRLANNVEFVVGTDGGKLRRSVQRRVRAKGFVVMEKKVGRAAESDTSNTILLKNDVTMVNDRAVQTE